MMAGIRGKNTRPEMVIRRGLHAKGFRYRLHDRKLPAKPDLVFRSHQAVILVHGCFWHGHGCHLFKWPSSRTGFWEQKITRNRQRDAKSLDLLRGEGWRVLVIWECALKGRARKPVEDVIAEVAGWLRSEDGYTEITGGDDGAG